MPIIWDDEKSNIIWDDQKGVGEIMTPQTFKRKTLQERITSRKDLYGQAVQGIQEELLAKHPSPLKRINILLQSIGGVAQRGEAIVAAPFYEMPRGIEAMLKGVKQAISGEKPYELGDIARQAGIPEPMAAGLGLLGTGILGGALVKLVKIGSIADDFAKVETTYGKDIGKNVIRWTTGMPNPAIEHGMKRGWKNVLTKENLNPTIPTQVAKDTLNKLKEISIKEYDEYGKTINKINKGFVKGIDLLDTTQQELVKAGYMNIDGTDTLKIKSTLVNTIKKMWDTWGKNIQPDENVPIPFLQSLREIVRKKIPQRYLTGKSRSLNEEQRFAKNLYNKFNELIGFNSFGIENKELTLAKRSYRTFKNFEARILSIFSETVGQETLPTADRIVNVFNLQSTKAIEELGKLRQIDNFLISKGYQSFENKLFDWLTTQSAIIQPQKQGASLYPFRLIAESAKYTTRQALKTGIPSFIGRSIEKTGRGISTIKAFGKETNLLPAAMIRTTRELETE